MNRTRLSTLLAALVASVAMTACGGGGDDPAPSPSASLSVSSVEFKDQSSGIGHRQVFNVTNKGTTAREVSAYIEAVPGASTDVAFHVFGCDYMTWLGGQADNKLQPGASCQMSVVFYPKATSKTYGATLVIGLKDDPAGPVDLPLTGNTTAVTETLQLPCPNGAMYFSDLGLCLIA